MMRMVAEAAVVISNSFALSLAVKVTVVTVAALIGTRMARRSRASVRHLVLAAAFIALLVLPFGLSIGPSIRVEVPLIEAPAAAAAITLGADAGSTTIDNRMAASYSDPPGRTPIPVSTVIAALWAIGTVLFLLPTVAGLWQLRRIRRVGRPWLHGEAILLDLAPEMGIKRRVVVLLHETIAGPMTCGILRPAIVFPPDARSWSDTALRRAMVHELEHVRRGDCLIHAVARVVCALYWFHPLVWMSWSRLGLEAERACDDAVLSRADATEYADQLLTLAERIRSGSSMPILAMANRNELTARITAVLDAGQRRGRPGTLCFTVALMAALLLIGVISPLRAVSPMPAPEPAQAPATPLEFEAVSIKRPADRQRGPFAFDFSPGGRLAAHTPLKALIESAYRISAQRLYWLDDAQLSVLSAIFDIEATAASTVLPPDAPPEARAQQFRLMLQSLLADRFKLAIHKETRDLPIYALVVANKGPRLKPSALNGKCLEAPGAECGFGGGPAGGLKGVIRIPDLANVLTVFVDREVVDRTGIQGLFDIDLPSWNPTNPVGTQVRLDDNNEPQPDPNDASIFTVLQERLGLRLESTRGPVEVYVIDHVELPAPN